MRVLSQKEPKARKKHRCNYCSGVIERGQIYNYAAIEYEGSVYTWKSHQTCLEIAIKLNMFEDSYDGLTQEYFNTFIREEYRDLIRGVELFSRDYVSPPFKEQLDYVLYHHLGIGKRVDNVN